MLKSRCDGDVTVDSLTPSTIDLSRLPPTKACLREHTARANYQTKIWKTANIPISEVPKPWEGHGWKDNGEPLWCHDDMILPVSLVDILAEDSEQLDDSDDDDDDTSLEYAGDSNDS